LIEENREEKREVREERRENKTLRMSNQIEKCKDVYGLLFTFFSV
jgi:hypothetical protein